MGGERGHRGGGLGAGALALAAQAGAGPDPAHSPPPPSPAQHRTPQGAGGSRVRGCGTTRTAAPQPQPPLGRGPLAQPLGAAGHHLPRAPGGSGGAAAGCSQAAWGRGRAAGLVGAPAGLPTAPCSPPALGLGSPLPEELPCCGSRAGELLRGVLYRSGGCGDGQLIRGISALAAPVKAAARIWGSAWHPPRPPHRLPSGRGWHGTAAPRGHRQPGCAQHPQQDPGTPRPCAEPPRAGALRGAVPPGPTSGRGPTGTAHTGTPGAGTRCTRSFTAEPASVRPQLRA